MRRWLLVLSTCVASNVVLPVHAMTSTDPASEAAKAPAVVQFRFTPLDAKQRPWEIQLANGRQGTFRFQGDPASQARAIQVTPDTWKAISSGREAVQAHRCQSGSRNLAHMGAKSVTYTLASGPVSCEFNYSDDSKLNKAAETFEAMAETMKIGDELARLHRFDRLGLDAEMQVLEQELSQGAAIEVSNIAPVLQSIAEDGRVMQRVRREAVRLLQGDPPQPMPM